VTGRANPLLTMMDEESIEVSAGTGIRVGVVGGAEGCDPSGDRWRCQGHGTEEVDQ
jgi:hypothetical protein